MDSAPASPALLTIFSGTRVKKCGVNLRENIIMIFRFVPPGWEPDAVVGRGCRRLIGGAALHGDRGDEAIIGAPGLAT